MATLIPFTPHEAVLLHEGYLDSINSGKPRLHAAKHVSDALRQMAKNAGKSIDDSYRPPAGISAQMLSLESAYFGYVITKPASKLFADVVSLYRTNRPEYEKLLKEAKAMAGEQKTVADMFSAWLAKKVSPAQLSELYLCYPEIEQFCKRIKVLKAGLFETTDLPTVKEVQRTINVNKLFQLGHKKQMKKMLSAVQYYTEFIKEIAPTINADKPVLNVAKPDNGTIPAQSSKSDLPEVQPIRTDKDKQLADRYPLLYSRAFLALRRLSGNRGLTAKPDSVLSACGGMFRVSDVTNILDHGSWSRLIQNDEYVFSSDIVVHEEPQQDVAVEDKIIDFSAAQDLSYTAPTLVTYFEEKVAADCSWKDAYIKIVRMLYEDYALLIPVGRSFTGSGRMDFDDKNRALSIMTDPKPVVGTMYLETNYSATDIVRKIKALLDICRVDYENVVIHYKAKEQINKRNVASGSAKLSGAVVVAQNNEGKITSTAFYSYLFDVLHVASATCRSYVSAINTVESFAANRGYEAKKLYDCTPEMFIATVKALQSDSAFAELNAAQHYRFSAALNRFLECSKYLCGNPNSQEKQTAAVESQKKKIDTAPYERVMEERFAKGFRLGSTLDMKKFRRTYEELNGASLDKGDAEIEAVLRACGIVHEEKVFLPRLMISPEIKTRLMDYIHSAFEDGKSSVYYEALFKEFSEDFLDYYIYNADMLRSYLAFVNDGSFFVGKNQLTKEEGITADPLEEIRCCLKEAGVPVETDQLCSTLSHLPRANIVAILGGNLEFVRNSKGVYFHADVLALSEEELENISELIDDSIRQHRFISGSELMNAIRAKYPMTYEAYAAFSDLGWRDALKYKLGDRYSFRGNIISRVNETLTMSDVFGNLADGKKHLTMDELLQFADEMGTVIYFDPVYEKALRINETEFVSKDQAKFRVRETDAILDRFCTGNYMPLGKVNEFGIFPDAGFPWTSYLLEHYVADFSERYRLVHKGYNRNCAVGAIVKRQFGVDNMDDLVVDILAESTIPLNKANALDLLSREGYVAARTYSGIERLLIRAKAQRNSKG